MVTAERALARLTVSEEALTAEISDTAVELLSLITHVGVKPSVVEKLSATEETLELLTIEPRSSVEPELIEAQPVPHVGVPPLPRNGTLLVPVAEAHPITELPFVFRPEQEA